MAAILAHGGEHLIGLCSLTTGCEGVSLQFVDELYRCYCVKTNVLCTLQVRNGHIKRITDNDIQSLVLEIVGTNVR